jgi:hypothetical protein
MTQTSGRAVQRRRTTSVGRLLFAAVLLGQAFAPLAAPNPKNFCTRLAHAIKASHVGSSPVVNWKEVDGYTVYLGLDLDGDKTSDKVSQSCGTDGTCLLEVVLSTGDGYNFSDRGFKVIAFEGRNLILVGDSYPPENIGRRTVHALGDRAPSILCEQI